VIGVERQINFRLSADEFERAKRRAAAEDRSLSSLTRRALLLYLDTAERDELAELAPLLLRSHG
jgi:hypothetical protein